MPKLKKPVVLKGIQMAVHSPTEERLMVQIENLTPERFAPLARTVEDYMRDVDDAYTYSETKTHVESRRGWTGRGRRISSKSRKRLIRFSPYPNRFSNVLRMLRRDIYMRLNRECIVLKGQSYGRYQQNIYILPYAVAPTFMNFIDDLNKKVDDLNNKIREFKKSRYAKKAQEILREYGIKQAFTENGNHLVSHVTVDMTPLALETQTVKNMLDEEHKRMFERLSKEEQKSREQLELEERRGMERVAREVERSSREFVTKAISDLQTKINPVVKRFVSTKKVRAKSIKNDIKRIQNVAISVGLEELAKMILQPLAEVVDHPEKAQELFGVEVTGLDKEVDARLKSLADSIP